MKTNTAVEKKVAGSWLKSFSKNHDKPGLTLVCFPFAGGGANIYRNWPSFLDNQIEVKAVALPGREARILEQNISNVDDVCDAIVNELVALHLHEPIAFFGHSMGSMLAYEVAARLQENYNWVPKMLIVSGRQAPHKKMGGTFHLSPDEVFINELKRLNGTPNSIFEDEEMRKIVLSILRADYTLLETYAIKTKVVLSAPIVTCCGDSDSEVMISEMQHWAELTSMGCTHHVFEGGHFYLSEKMKELIGIISAQLEVCENEI
jgi:surfactin synthase thioesterase subunit